MEKDYIKLNTLDKKHEYLEVWECFLTNKNIYDYTLKEISEYVYVAFYKEYPYNYAGTYFWMGEWYECMTSDPIQQRYLSDEEREIWEGLLDLLPLSQKNEHKKYQRSLMSKDLRFEILTRDNFTCCICGRSRLDNKDIKLEVDHKLPISQGGKTIESNLWTLCFECNHGKLNKKVPQLIY